MALSDTNESHTLRLKTDIEEIARLTAEIERLKAERDKTMRALESLTPSGSEFVNDVERCVAFIRRTRDSLMENLRKFKCELDKAQAELEQLRKEGHHA